MFETTDGRLVDRGAPKSQKISNIKKQSKINPKILLTPSLERTFHIDYESDLEISRFIIKVATGQKRFCAPWAKAPYWPTMSATITKVIPQPLFSRKLMLRPPGMSPVNTKRWPQKCRLFAKVRSWPVIGPIWRPMTNPRKSWPRIWPPRLASIS